MTIIREWREGLRNIKLVLAYDGTAYHGFQRQANALTVQQVVEERLEKIFGHSLRINGAARTDSGVHAYGQVVNFYTAGTIPVDRICPAGNGLLPPDIVIRTAEEMPPEFHARFSSLSKIYEYRVHVSDVPDPFLRNWTWRVPGCPDILPMQQALRLLEGEHDFSAFRAAGGPPVDPVRRILAAMCRQEANMVIFTFWGTGFLYHMVRNLVGTLLDVGWGRTTVPQFATILSSRDRTKAGITAPPQGLYLKEVFYDENC